MNKIALRLKEVVPGQELRHAFLCGTSYDVRHEFARLLHTHGMHSEGPFIVASLMSLPSVLRDKSLFGAEQSGWIEQARGGTLLLDELDGLSLASQHRFVDAIIGLGAELRVIVGSRYEWDLLMTSGALHDELKKWMLQFSPHQIFSAGKIKELYPDARRHERTTSKSLSVALREYVERILETESEDLHTHFIEKVERPLITAVLKYTSGNQLKASSILGLNRNTLRKKIQSLGIQISKGSNE
ncbi:helix-turn-helix domain-containing protein [Swingsia samuiensis]|uniref:Nitrogen assimilation regulator n=1 Tax=Swingsia samuiensis TaxID=1293412 RepID=A0A4Y6ULQ7_9PROT|nr:helix-turn-helix domain-containing protein [Swingsia samuiensis]QDH17321.1 nitrogen assimilation regulator [Swingsia samuiensis]